MRSEDMGRVHHMLDAAREALEFVANKTRSDIEDDRLLVLGLTLKYLICFFVAVAASAACAEKPTPVIREEHNVRVEGVEERWRLEWETPPSPVCSPDEPDVWSTCPCEGFAFGERGQLTLVRKRPEQEDERLSLNRLIQECGDYDQPADLGEVVLRRWDVEGKDWDDRETPGFAARVRARPDAKVMRFEDYDHDGRATEFLFQVGVLPCGKRMCVAIGISLSKPHLHVFSAAEHPKKPLVLQDHQWEALREAKGPVTVIDCKCGDHGSNVEEELELRVDRDGIHATKSVYRCNEDGTRGRFLSRCILGDDCGSEEDESTQRAK